MYKNLIFIGLIAIVFFLVDTFKIDIYLHGSKWYILTFFVAFSYLYNVLIKLGFENNRKNFVQFYLSTVIIRLVASLIFIAVFLYLKVENPNLFVLNFFALYLCFSFFEIQNLYCKLRRF